MYPVPATSPPRGAVAAPNLVGMVYLTREEFESAVSDALDAMPADLMRQLDNVAFFVDAEPDPGDPELPGP